MGYCNCDKVVFSGSSVASQTVTAGSPVGFTKNLSAGVQYTDTSVTLRRPGLYHVIVDASAATTEATATNVTLQLMKNGTQVGKVQSTATSASATSVVGLSFSAIVKVDPTCCPLNDNSASLTFVNSGGSAVYSNITVTIVRL